MSKERSDVAKRPLDRRVGGLDFHPGMLCTVPFALGTATVRLLGWHCRYRDGEMWRVEDVVTGHQDHVGEEWLTPNA